MDDKDEWNPVDCLQEKCNQGILKVTGEYFFRMLNNLGLRNILFPNLDPNVQLL